MTESNQNTSNPHQVTPEEALEMAIALRESTKKSWSEIAHELGQYGYCNVSGLPYTGSAIHGLVNKKRPDLAPRLGQSKRAKVTPLSSSGHITRDEALNLAVRLRGENISWKEINRELTKRGFRNRSGDVYTEGGLLTFVLRERPELSPVKKSWLSDSHRSAQKNQTVIARQPEPAMMQETQSANDPVVTRITIGVQLATAQEILKMQVSDTQKIAMLRVVLNHGV